MTDFIPPLEIPPGEIPNLYNADAEKALLGSVLINPDIFSTIDVKSDYFFIQRNAEIWNAYINLYLRDVSIDFETVSDELDRMGWLSQIGGPAYLSTLLTITPTSLHAESYAQIIKDYAKRRNLLNIANKIATISYDKDSVLEDKLPILIDDITKVVAKSNGAEHWKVYLDELYDDIHFRISNPKEIWGIPTGYRTFDKITGGLQKGEILLLSGKPGVGKSIWAMQAGEQMSSVSPGAIYSVEMPGIQTVRRDLSANSGVESRKMKTGNISDEEMTSILDSFDRLNKLPIYMSDSSNWSTSELRADLQRLKLKYGIEWFIFDYMFLASDGMQMSETERTSLLSRNFKLICRQLKLAGIVIHSMRKQGMEKTQPEQQELRSSGQVSYDADLICFVNEFIPMCPEDQSITPADRLNLRTFTFGKGRELEQPKQYIHMVKRPNIPSFGDMERE